MGFFEGCLTTGAIMLLVGFALLWPLAALDADGEELTFKNYLLIYPKSAGIAVFCVIAVIVGFVLSPLIFLGTIGAAIYCGFFSDNWNKERKHEDVRCSDPLQFCHSTVCDWWGWQEADREAQG